MVWYGMVCNGTCITLSWCTGELSRLCMIHARYIHLWGHANLGSGRVLDGIYLPFGHSLVPGGNKMANPGQATFASNLSAPPITPWSLLASGRPGSVSPSQTRIIVQRRPSLSYSMALSCGNASETTRSAALADKTRKLPQYCKYHLR
jgi:hypothetical protein